MVPGLPLAHVEQLYVQVDQEIQRLLEVPRARLDALAHFAILRALLEALPLNTGEFATASNRLANARAYLAADEEGAALFELRLLRRSLARLES